MSQTAGQAAPQAVVVVERTYRATPEELWSLWTTKAGFESWWGPEGFRVEVHALEPREGGALVYDMIADAPEAIAAMQEMGQPISHDRRDGQRTQAGDGRLPEEFAKRFVPMVPPHADDEELIIAQLHHSQP
jgi:hypothetical protein